MTQANHPRLRLIEGFLTSAERYGNNVALDVDGHELTYTQLLKLAQSVAADIADCRPNTGSLVGVRSGPPVRSYAGRLGSLLAGRGFVPINPSHPIERAINIVKRARLRVLVIGSDAISLIGPLLKACPEVAALIAPIE